MSMKDYDIMVESGKQGVIMKRKQMTTFLLLISLIASQLNIFSGQIVLGESQAENSVAQESSEDNMSNIDAIRWYGVYDDYPQLTLDEIKQYYEHIIKEGSTELNREDIIELLGQPSDEYVVGASEFLVYYSINDSESIIVYLQLFSQELADELNESMASNTSIEEAEAAESELESTESEVEDEVVESEPYLIEVSKLVVNDNDFQPLKLSEDEVRIWQESDEDDREISTIDDLTNLIGPASEVIYNFEADLWVYNWFRNSDAVEGLNYLSVVVDNNQKIQSLSIISETESESESEASTTEEPSAE